MADTGNGLVRVVRTDTGTMRAREPVLDSLKYVLWFLLKQCSYHVSEIDILRHRRQAA